MDKGKFSFVLHQPHYAHSTNFRTWLIYSKSWWDLQLLYLFLINNCLLFKTWARCCLLQGIFHDTLPLGSRNCISCLPPCYCNSIFPQCIASSQEEAHPSLFLCPCHWVLFLNIGAVCFIKIMSQFFVFHKAVNSQEMYKWSYWDCVSKMHLCVHTVHVQNMLLYAKFVFFCFTSLFHLDTTCLEHDIYSVSPWWSCCIIIGSKRNPPGYYLLSNLVENPRALRNWSTEPSLR